MPETLKNPMSEKTPLALLDCIKEYAKAGYATFAAMEDKAPAHHFKWKQSKVDNDPNLLKYPYGSFGVRLKTDDLVIDLDPRNMKGRKVWKELKQQISTLSDVERKATVARSGRGGLHIYLRKPPNFRIKKNINQFPGVDFLTEGAYVIGAGSIINNNTYIFLTPPPFFPEVNAPGGLLDLIKKPVVDLGPTRHKEFSDVPYNTDRFVDYLEKHAPKGVKGQEGAHRDVNTFKVACRGRDYNLSMQKTFELMMKYYNPTKCQPIWTSKELQQKIMNAYKYNEAPAGTRDPQVALPDMSGKKNEDPNKWMAKLKYNTKVIKGEVIKLNLQTSLKNCVLLLKHEMGIKGAFIYNAFNERLEIRGHVPWEARRINKYNAINDHEVECIRLHLSYTHEIEFSTQTMWKAVDLVAADNSYHPIKDVLETYKWDNAPRVGSWLQTYCGGQDTPLNREIGRKVLTAMVARIYSPGCKFDYVLVLEGMQGIGKSTTCEILGGEWFGDAPIDPRDKDSIPYIHSKWVIELSEMVTTKKTDTDKLKNFISRREDDVRLPYARVRQRFPRQCIFIGTINPDDVGYLTDPTGNRRFWPVYCQKFDLDGLKRDREQLLAEAIVIHKKGERLMLSPKFVKESEIEQLKRVALDPWQPIIEEWLFDNPKIDRTSTQHLYCNVLGGRAENMHTGHQRRISIVLKNLGWIKRQSRQGIKYVKPIKIEKGEVK